MHNGQSRVSIYAMEEETRLYEIGYLLRGDMEEDKAVEINEAVKKTIKVELGAIMQEGKSEKKNLAYPIKKQGAAYFNWLRFILPAEKTQSLVKYFGKIDFLRFLLTELKPEKEPSKRPPKIKPAKMEILASEERKEKTKQIQKEEEAQPKERLQVEEIDKKIEEILGQ